MPARIRTTWTSRKADDPRAMNQDHLSRQPSADQYDIGGPSEFAEDVAPADWKGQTRNEIGMPEIRPESLKQAAEFSVLKDRAALCLKLATKLLGKSASESLIEDQAIAFMNMGDHGVISTLGRIAASQEDSEDEDEDEVQEKQAGEMPPQFKENAEKKQEEAAEKKEAAQEEQADETQQKQAQDEQQAQDQGQAKQAQEQVAQQIQQLAQQLQALQQQLGQQNADQVVQQQIAQQQIAQQQPQVAQQQPQVAQQQPQVAQQQPQVAQQQIQEDTSVLDQLLAQDEVQAPMANEDIELFGGAFDTEAAQLGDEDQTLQAIFAGGQETQDALAAQGCVTASAPVRTVGTRPTVGVARIASASSRSAGSQDSSLDSLWSAPPDVSSAFR